MRNNKMRCAICRHSIEPDEPRTIRQAWMQKTGGGGVPPRSAWVHAACDSAEQERLKKVLREKRINSGEVFAGLCALAFAGFVIVIVIPGALLGLLIWLGLG